MIDQSRLQELRNEMGADVFADVIHLFLEESDEVITGLLDKRLAPDEIGDRLQFISGSAANLGLYDLAAVCRLGRARAYSAEPSPICPKDLRKTFDASRQAFLTALTRLETPLWER